MSAMRCNFMGRFRRGCDVILGLAGAAVLSACAAEVPSAPVANEPAAAVEPAPAPAYLDPPFARVPTEGKAIFVNIPSFELIAFRDGEEVLRSKVIVGSPKHQTPKLNVETSVVRFRPTWTPTAEMIRDEGISPRTRAPGPQNPLGLMAIRFANRFGKESLIYLHDTNNPGLFERENRALSHGCIRVEKVDELAAFVLDIPLDEVRRHAEGNRTVDMETGHVPVFVRYETSFPDRNGDIRDHDDVYGWDAARAAAMSASADGTDWEPLPTDWN